MNDIPTDWPVPPDALLERAVEVSMFALSDRGEHPVSERLARYYRLAGNYAGAAFANLEPIVGDDITPTDLFAVTLLSVDVDPRVARRLLTGPLHTEALAALNALPGTADLAEADAATLAKMASLYRIIKRAFRSDTAKRSEPWVAPSKLCSRKRPALFPVRDSSICGMLDLYRFTNYEIDYQVFRHLARDKGVTAAIDQAHADAHNLGPDYCVDDSRLRVLDAALWTYAKT